jgi:hypothetical protein
MRIAATLAFALLIGISASSASAPGAWAQGRHDHDGWHESWGHDGWRDHDIHRFHEHGFDRWRGGHWERRWIGERFGWWWVIGPSWYYAYPTPIYPYPDPYLPPGYAPPSPTYYYCDDPPGYYPYVPTCRTPWRAVPAG